MKGLAGSTGETSRRPSQGPGAKDPRTQGPKDPEDEKNHYNYNYNYNYNPLLLPRPLPLQQALAGGLSPCRVIIHILVLDCQKLIRLS